MANVSLIWDKPSDRGAFSGGSWAGSLPLANLKSKDVQAFARSTSASASHTKFMVDLGTARPEPLSGFSLLNHNGTLAATWRIVVTSDPTDADPLQRKLDSGVRPLWTETVVPGSLPWGAFPWNGISADAYPGGTVALYFHPTVALARYVWVYISDTANPAGYFQAGRFLAGLAWSPQQNADYGASFAWEDPSEIRRTRGGRRLEVKRPSFRKFTLNLSGLTSQEAFGSVFEINRQLGKTGDFLLVIDPEDEGFLRFKRTIYASLVEPSPTIENSFEQHSWNITAEELI